MSNKIAFYVRLANSEGVAHFGNIESTFGDAREDAAKAFPQCSIGTIYPVEHHERLNWLHFLDELRRKEAEANDTP